CFFFQAEDGIRDFHVTGVQTCAHPISTTEVVRRPDPREHAVDQTDARGHGRPEAACMREDRDERDLAHDRALATHVGSGDHPQPDPKSTRLNSSHVKTSYAVFCSKKKK